MKWLLSLMILASIGCKKADESGAPAISKTCIMGQYKNGEACESAQVGYFAPGDQHQYGCPAGQYSESPGQISCSVCKNKPENASLVTYLTAPLANTRFCPIDKITVCSPSYRLVSEECIPCANKPMNGQDSIYAQNVVGNTSSCILLTVVCDAGYNLVSGTCVDNTPNPTNLENFSAPVASTLTISPSTVASGFDVPVMLYCAECSAIDVNGVLLTASALIHPGDTFSLQWIGGVAINTVKNVSYNYGGSSANWRIHGLDSIPDRLNIETTGIASSVPNEFGDLQPITVTSQPFTLTGFDVPVSLECALCSAIVVNGLPATNPTTVNPNDQVSLTYMGVIDDNSVIRIPFTNGGTSDSWSIFTEDLPNHFAVSTDQSTNAKDAPAKSLTIFISGMTGTAQLFISDILNNTFFSINGGSPVTYATIKNGDAVVFHSVFGDYETTRIATIRIVKNAAERIVEWEVTTRTGFSCLLANQSVLHGETVSAYDEPTPLSLCGLVAEIRTCVDGNLTGSKPSPTCANPCANPFSGIMRSGTTVVAYASATPENSCNLTSEIRTCADGTLSGSYSSQTCTDGCQTVSGAYIAEGASATFYKEQVVGGSDSCQSETRTCSNQTLSGTFRFGSCDDGCYTADGVKVPTGTSMTLYSEAAGTCATTQSVTCDKDGLSSTTHRYKNCVQGCVTPWGTTIANNATVQAWQSPGPTYPCVSQTRTCTNYSLTGSYTNQSCISAPANCARPGGGAPILHGSSVTAYRDAITLLCQTNPSETRTCNNGTLSGSYTILSPSSRNCNCYHGYAAKAGWYKDGTGVHMLTGPGLPCLGKNYICVNGDWYFNDLSGGPLQNVTSQMNSGSLPKVEFCAAVTTSPNATGR